MTDRLIGSPGLPRPLHSRKSIELRENRGKAQKLATDLMTFERLERLGRGLAHARIRVFLERLELGDRTGGLGAEALKCADGGGPRHF